MIKVRRHPNNPILAPNEDVPWLAVGAFNGCPIKEGSWYHMVFRSLSERRRYYEHDLEVSQIGYAKGQDGINFGKPKLLITPEYNWEQFGCEDPRITKLDDRYYIFYTALGDFPHSAEGIKIGVVVTKDFEKILVKHQATHFNSKAMALFPERIDDRMAAILTVNPDHKPAQIAVVYFDKEEEIWSPPYWHNWLNQMKKHLVRLQRGVFDHVEIGAPPIRTSQGWLLVYSYTTNYLNPPPVFGIEAALLDLKDPTRILGHTPGPLMVPKEEYEIYGKVPRVVFPSGALIEDKTLRIYYGAADTTCCLAEVELKALLEAMMPRKMKRFVVKKQKEVKLEKFSGNPIIKPNQKHPWESKYTFNPAAVWEGGKVHLLYRAMGEDETSVLGYAASSDGFSFEERLAEPVYVPREDFEKKAKPGYSGCEDPRISKINGTFYMTYTAYDGVNPTKAALTSIKVNDFLNKNWQWSLPKIISCPRRSDKNAGIFPEKFENDYIFFHRIGGCIWLDHVADLNFGDDDWVGGKMILCPMPDRWDSLKVGIAGPPIKTDEGWLVVYHSLSREDDQYRLGALLLDLKNPDDILAKLPYPILEPTQDYEKKGLRPDAVFSCGGVVVKGKLFVYYGAADEVVGVATASLDELLEALKQNLLPPGPDG